MHSKPIHENLPPMNKSPPSLLGSLSEKSIRNEVVTIIFIIIKIKYIKTKLLTKI